MLIVSARGAPSERRRRRRRTRPAEPQADPEPLPLTRVTVVTAAATCGDPRRRARWLDRVAGDEAGDGGVRRRALRSLNRALHAHGAAEQDPYSHEMSRQAQASALRVGYGEGEQVADGQWSDARE